MLNIIYCELLKLKKSYIIFLIFIGGCFMTIFEYLIHFIIRNVSGDFQRYAYNMEQVNFVVLYVALFPLIVACIFSREFTEKTSNILYSYPIGRTKIFIGKLITTYLIIFLVYIIQSTSIYISFYALYGYIEYNLIVNDIKANVVSLIFQFLIIPIPILISNISRNIIMPAMYGIVSFMLTVFLMSSHFLWTQYFPLLTPYYSAKYFYYPEDINFNNLIFSGLICFALSMILCIYQHNKTDIN